MFVISVVRFLLSEDTEVTSNFSPINICPERLKKDVFPLPFSPIRTNIGFVGIIDSKNKPLLSQADIKSDDLENKLQELANKFKYQSVSFHEINIVSRGTIKVYNQIIPYAKFEAKANKLPFSDLAGIIGSIKTSDGSEKLILAISEKKKYSQLITEEFYKNISEN